MAYVAAAISTADLALAAADKPIVAGITSLASGGTGRWVTSVTGTFASADDTNATYPFVNAIDGLVNVQTRPTTSGTAMAMIFDFSANPIDIDMVCFFNHTLDSDACTDCDIEIANDSAFSAQLIELASFNPSTLLSSDRRFSRLDLQDSTSAFGVATRYTDVPYARVQFTFSGSVIPRIGEIAFARRRQLKWKPNVNDGYDPDETTGDVARYTSGSGIKKDAVFHAGASVMHFTWTPNATAQHDDWTEFNADTGFSTRPFLYIDNPNSAPNDVYLMAHETPAAFGMPFVGWQARTRQLNGIEQGPYFLADVQT